MDVVEWLDKNVPKHSNVYDCPKCGSDQLYTHWGPDTGFRTCNQCGYRWFVEGIK